MGITTGLNNLILIPAPEEFVSSYYGVYTMDAVGERIANVLQVLKAGNIRSIYFKTGTVTEEDTLKISLQSISTTTGAPDGTILGSGAAGYTTASFLDTNDNVWLGPFQFGVDVAVTPGQYVGVVFEWNSYSDGNISIPSCQFGGTAMNTRYMVTDLAATPGTWSSPSNTARAFNAILVYDDGTVHNQLCVPEYASMACASGGAVIEAGNYCIFQFPFRAIGIWSYLDTDAATTVYLRDADDDILASVTVNPSIRSHSGANYNYYFFDNYVDIQPGIAYRVTFKAETTTTISGSTSYFSGTAPSSLIAAALPTAGDCKATSRTTGAWTDYTDRVTVIGLIASGFNDGGGGLPILGGSVVR